MAKILIMSDIHGNLSALEAVLKQENSRQIEGMILLGDLIDYGPRSNEVIKRIQEISKSQIKVNIWGNHEKAIMESDDSRFSSERGKKSMAYTSRQLSENSKNYLEQEMRKEGYSEFELEGKKCLAVHGSREDFFWKSISHEERKEEYAAYDIVFSGHSHIPHYFEHFYPMENSVYRGKKKTVFINPGSVGQPRNHNPNAQYAVLDTETMTVRMCGVSYDIEKEMDLYSEEIDYFYKERLKLGV